MNQPVGSRASRATAGVILAAAVFAACSTGGHTSAPTAEGGATTTTAPAASTTAPGVQTSGSRTVLSANGLNVRAAPSASAPVVGSAAQGVVLKVLGYSSSAGGWFNVRGETVTGWISADPTLSASGEFQAYTSAAFSALYPADWTESALASTTPPTTAPPTTSSSPQSTPAGGPPAAPSSVAFRPGLGTGDIVVTSAGTVSQLPQGRAGYGRVSVTQVVVCGVTAGLVVFQRAAGSPASPSTSVPESLSYLAEIRFAVDSQNALGLYADMPDLGSTFAIFKEIVASVTFNSPQCGA